MGNCFNTDPVNQEVEKKLAEAEQKENNTSKILFLGSGGGGKSTIFKQLGYIINGGDDVNLDDEQLKSKIYAQIIEQMQVAIKLYIDSEEIKYQSHIEIIQKQQIFPAPTTFSCDLADSITFIWNNCDKLKHDMTEMTFKHKMLEESSMYFWNELERIKKPNWIPNVADLLNLRVKTTGITQRRFTINKKKFHIFDVGGQMSERKKWINCFADVTALLFVVSLSSYNQNMFEDANKNCMVDASETFDKMVNHDAFRKSDVIIFFNKLDLFEKKIKYIPITDCPAFEDYQEYKTDDGLIVMNEFDCDECCLYIKSKFNELNRKKRLYSHFTCAMHRENIESVFNDVQNIILMNKTNKLMNNPMY